MATTIEPHHRYRVRYKQQAGNYRWTEWEFIGDYLGTNVDGDSVWSMRPDAGTGHIPVIHILRAEEVKKSTPNKQPWKV